MNRISLAIFAKLSRVFAPALPTGDVGRLLKSKVSIFPLKGRSASRSGFQSALEAAHAEGKWIPKILLLPDVGQFTIKLNTFNATLLASGIISRYPSDIEIKKNRSRRMNRYLSYMYWRLFNYKENYNSVAYWTATKNLIRASNCYTIVCLHSVDRNIYRSLTLADLEHLLKTLRRMRGDYFLKNIETHTLSKVQQHYIKFFRVYIPKSEDKLRPLGVPTRSWRIFLKMWLIPIMGFTGDKIPKGFHGYIPGRGTGTAWQTILSKVIHKQNIYEVDFKQFFPSIPTDCLLYFMVNDLGFTSDTANYFYQMNNSLPIFIMGQNGPEVSYTKAHQKSLLLEAGKLGKPIPGLTTTGLREPGTLVLENFSRGKPYSINEAKFIKGKSLLDEKSLAFEFTNRSLPFVKQEDFRFRLQMLKASKGIPLNRRLSAQEESALMAQLGHSDVVFKAVQQWFYLESKGGVGLPQGGGLSPYLSILYLEMVLERLGIPEGVEYLFYADDGIFYSDSYDLLKGWLDQVFGHSETSFFNWGIVIHPEKSGWVKVKGKWKTSLKFLGIYYIPGKTLGTSQLIACTRSGKSNLEFDKRRLLKVSFSNDLLYGLSDMTIENRLALLKGFKSNSYTKAMISYYETLQLIGRALPKTGVYFYEYLYLLSSLLEKGLTIFVMFFFTGANYLDKRVALEQFLDIQSVETRRVAFEKFGTADSQTILQVISYLKSGYKRDVEGETRATNKLLDLLEDNNPLVYDPVTTIDHSYPIIKAAQLLVSPSYALFNDYLKVTYNGYYILRNSVMKYARPLELHRFIGWYTSLLFWWVNTPWQYLIAPGLLKDIHIVHEYFERHWARNLAASRYYGLLFSRLYMGSWRCSTVEQDFKYTYKLGSLAMHLQDREQYSGQANIFVGSSYAYYEMVKLLSYQSRNPRRKGPFRLFSEGFLSKDSWETRSSIN